MATTETLSDEDLGFRAGYGVPTPGHPLTLRLYLMAHAPKVPEWFRATLPDDDADPLFALSQEDQLAYWQYVGYCDPESQDVKRWRAMFDARAAWKERQDNRSGLVERERHLQWPRYWADEMIQRAL